MSNAPVHGRAPRWSLSRLLDATVRARPVQWLYRTVIVRVPPRPLPATRRRATADGRQPRIGYYLWRFPVLSQTFVCRELSALQQTGLELRIFADGAENVALVEPELQSLLDVTTYLGPTDADTRLRLHGRFLRRRPRAYLQVLGFVLTHRYDRYKDLATDVAVFSRAICVAGVLDDNGITRVHAPWCDRCALLAMLAATLLGISYSVQGRAHDIHRNASLPGLRERLAAADFVVTNSEYNRHHLARVLGRAEAPPVVTVYNGIDVARFRPPEARASEPRGETRLLCVGRLIEQKGLLDLLAACRQLLDDGRRISCEIVGGGEPDLYMNYLLRLRKAHRALRLEGHVTFLGARLFTEVLAAHARADMFVLPCVIAADGSRDITPNALIEAMAMQLPVVSTTVTAIPEIVEDGVSGLLVPPHDPHALAVAIARLADDPALRRRLGAAARQRVSARFDAHENVRQYVRLFREDTAH